MTAEFLKKNHPLVAAVRGLCAVISATGKRTDVAGIRA